MLAEVLCKYYELSSSVSECIAEYSDSLSLAHSSSEKPRAWSCYIVKRI